MGGVLRVRLSEENMSLSNLLALQVEPHYQVEKLGMGYARVHR